MQGGSLLFASTVRSWPPPALARSRASAQGRIVVAAAGNDGPTAPPRYPAAYPWAVAVTAVDRRDQVYSRAVRGPHLAFAAAGVRVQLPDRHLRPGPVRSGTSYAVPQLTAAIALAQAANAGAAPRAVLEALAGHARDLGAPGRDPVFGWGVIAASRLCRNGWEFDRTMVSKHSPYQVAGHPATPRPPLKLHN